MNRVYCSYFDHRYLAKGLAMIRSLRRHEKKAQAWVLCLSDQAKIILDDMVEPGVTTLSLADFEAGDVELARAKADGRSMVEYYFTITPSLARYVMDRTQAEVITYLDGDLWFLAPVEPIYREMGEASILIIPHRFAPSQRHLEMHGIYNVGWNSFRNDERGRACLEWWRERNNEWCFDWVDKEHGRYCDQRYLDYFSEKFSGVHVLRHRGANVAPWNVGASVITKTDGAVYVDGDQLLFFHFHGIKRLATRQFLTNHRSYGAPLDSIVRHDLYEPYLKELMAIEAEIESGHGTLEKNSARDPHGSKGNWWQRVKAATKIRRAVLQGYAINVPK